MLINGKLNLFRNNIMFNIKIWKYENIAKRECLRTLK